MNTGASTCAHRIRSATIEWYEATNDTRQSDMRQGISPFLLLSWILLLFWFVCGLRPRRNHGLSLSSRHYRGHWNFVSFSNTATQNRRGYMHSHCSVRVPCGAIKTTFRYFQCFRWVRSVHDIVYRSIKFSKLSHPSNRKNCCIQQHKINTKM